MRYFTSFMHLEKIPCRGASLECGKWRNINHFSEKSWENHSSILQKNERTSKENITNLFFRQCLCLGAEHQKHHYREQNMDLSHFFVLIVFVLFLVFFGAFLEFPYYFVIFSLVVFLFMMLYGFMQGYGFFLLFGDFSHIQVPCYSVLLYFLYFHEAHN